MWCHNVTGYCISHFDVRWGLNIEYDLEAADTDLFLKGLRYSPIGRIQYLLLNELVSFSQIFSQLGKFCQLNNLDLFGINFFDSSDVNILQQLIAPGSELRRIYSFNCEFNLDALQSLFDQSSLEELTINNDTMYFASVDLSPHKNTKNTNLKRLTITGDLLQPLAAVLPNITSLTYLRINYPVGDSDLLVLIDLLQSHTTLEELELSIHECSEYDEYNWKILLTNLPKLIEAADSCQKKLEIDKAYYNCLPNDNDDVNRDEDDYNEEEK